MNKLKIKSEDFVNDLTFSRFQRANKFRMEKEVYRRDMLSAYVAGVLCVSQGAISSHANNPYKDCDELVGDLQEVLREAWEIFVKSEGVYRPFSIEEIAENADGDLFSLLRKG